MTGTVTNWFGPRCQWGRILGADGRRFFVHRDALRGAQALTVGQQVEFIPTDPPRGPRAEKVRVIEAPAAVVHAMPKEVS